LSVAVCAVAASPQVVQGIQRLALRVDPDERSVHQDLEAAVAWYRRAAEAGNAGAQYNLASMFAEGEGCERDLAAAREWLRRAIAGGYEHTEGLLAHLDSLK